MKATGIVRRIDDLGRVVIPKEIRRTMRIREGDPLEIYTSKDGEVIFKKYSLMGGVDEFAAQLCDTLSKSTGTSVAVINDYAIKSTTIASGAETYPQGCIEAMEKVFRTIAVPASEIALDLGNAKCMNVVLFGAMCDSLGCPQIDWEQVVADTVPEKVKELNIRAFRAGREAAQKCR